MTGVIILAAGSSSRLGLPKQNLIYKGQTLLQRAIEAALATAYRPVITVLGANADVITPTISKKPARIIYNQDWEEGMASSIRLGISVMQKFNPETDAVILMLCDQPFVTTIVLNQLNHVKSGKGIVASAYNETIGAPVLFDKIYFDELHSLKGHEGAKKLLLKYPDDVIAIPFPLGSIDTVEDYDRL